MKAMHMLWRVLHDCMTGKPCHTKAIYVFGGFFLIKYFMNVTRPTKQVSLCNKGGCFALKGAGSL